MSFASSAFALHNMSLVQIVVFVATAKLELVRGCRVPFTYDGNASRAMKLDNSVRREDDSASPSLMFILGVTVGAAVPLLILASS